MPTYYYGEAIFITLIYYSRWSDTAPLSELSEDIGWSVFDAPPIRRLLQVEGERVVVHLKSPDLLLALAKR